MYNIWNTVVWGTITKPSLALSVQLHRMWIYFHHLSCVEKQTPGWHVRNLKAFVILSDAVQCEMAMNHAPPRHMTVRLVKPQDFGVLEWLRPQVCWPASAPPSGRAWTPTSRWSCCCWLCGCGCWGPLCSIWSLCSWLCCVDLLQWLERAAEKKKKKSAGGWWTSRSR